MRHARLLSFTLALCWWALAGLGLLTAAHPPHAASDPFVAALAVLCAWQGSRLVLEVGA